MGDRIELAIRRSGLTLGEVAERANVGAPWLSSAKGDRMKNPDWPGLKRVAEVCGETLAYFLEPTFRPLGVIPMDAAALEAPDVKTAVRSMRNVPVATQDALIRIAEELAKSP